MMLLLAILLYSTIVNVILTVVIIYLSKGNKCRYHKPAPAPKNESEVKENDRTETV